VEGRWLLPEDNRAILINRKVANDEGIKVGDTITLNINRRKSTWTVVGHILNVSDDQSNSFVPIDALGRETSSVNRGTIVMVQSQQQGADFEQNLIRNLRNVYTMSGYPPTFLMSASEIRAQNKTQFNMITLLMLMMALLAGMIGSIGLMGTMSINVVERRREIGVMRAIGALSGSILQIFIGEGVFLGFLSWLIAIPFSYPLARAFSNIVGTELMKVPLEFNYSIFSLFLWLFIVVVLSALASLWPALRATQMSVRETLAYE